MYLSDHCLCRVDRAYILAAHICKTLLASRTTASLSQVSPETQAFIPTSVVIQLQFHSGTSTLALPLTLPPESALQAACLGKSMLCCSTTFAFLHMATICLLC